MSRDGHCPACGHRSLAPVVVREHRTCPDGGTFTERCPACDACIEPFRWLDRGACHECGTHQDAISALRDWQYECGDLKPVADGPPYRFWAGQHYTAGGSWRCSCSPSCGHDGPGSEVVPDML